MPTPQCWFFFSEHNSKKNSLSAEIQLQLVLWSECIPRDASAMRIIYDSQKTSGCNDIFRWRRCERR